MGFIVHTTTVQDTKIESKMKMKISALLVVVMLGCFVKSEAKCWCWMENGPRDYKQCPTQCDSACDAKAAEKAAACKDHVEAIMGPQTDAAMADLCPVYQEYFKYTSEQCEAWKAGKQGWWRIWGGGELNEKNGWLDN